MQILTLNMQICAFMLFPLKAALSRGLWGRAGAATSLWPTVATWAASAVDALLTKPETWQGDDSALGLGDIFAAIFFNSLASNWLSQGSALSVSPGVCFPNLQHHVPPSGFRLPSVTTDAIYHLLSSNQRHIFYTVVLSKAALLMSSSCVFPSNTHWNINTHNQQTSHVTPI